MHTNEENGLGGASEDLLGATIGVNYPSKTQTCCLLLTVLQFGGGASAAKKKHSTVPAAPLVLWLVSCLTLFYLETRMETGALTSSYQ